VGFDKLFYPTVVVRRKRHEWPYERACNKRIHFWCKIAFF